MKQPVTIVGAGLAGCEAAWQLLRQGVPVRLLEMRPDTPTPAHQDGSLAQLVCSNSLRSNDLNNAVGLLKEELRRCGSLLMKVADDTAIPAGGALAVDRHRFSEQVEAALLSHPLLTFERGEVTEIPEGLTIIAAGPLVSPALAEKIRELTGSEQLFFHDAIAPIVDGESIDYEKAFFASRYGKGNGEDYLNCPMDKQQYKEFYQELLAAEVYPLKDFEKEKHFSGCMPLESMARYGEDSIRYGPLKPVGLELPDGGQAYAVLQLRKEDEHGTMYNLVGCQTRLRQGEQRRVFRMIPGLEQAEFLRYGSMHRNTYIDSPRLLDEYQRLRARTDLLFAGQITGVEGYVESMASGLMAGMTAAAMYLEQSLPQFPRETALGSLLAFLVFPKDNFQPMNVNFGLIPPLDPPVKPKKAQPAAKAARSLKALEAFLHPEEESSPEESSPEESSPEESSPEETCPEQE